MTADRDFDRQLATWLDQRAALSLPDRLLERSLERVGATGQRPGWFVADYWRAPRAVVRPATGPLPMPARLAVVAVVGMLAIGGAFYAIQHNQPAVGTPSQAPNTTSSPNTNPSAVPSASVVPAPDDAFPARPGMFDATRTVLLASDTVGWARTPSAIYRTRDMGATWTDVRPPGLPTMALVRFVDSDTMYVTSTYAGLPSAGGGPVTIAATHDGGASWVEATIDSPRLMAGMGFSFRTPDNGTLTFFTQDGKDLRVFGTADGGVTWTGPVRSSAPRMLYLLKDLSGDRVLVLTNSLTPGTPFDNNLNLSMDGGVTWITPSFPIGSHSPKGEMKGVAGLWADGSGQIVLAMDVFGGDLQIYTSADNGQTWQFVKDLGRSISHVQLLSATEWIFLTDAGVISTVDAGGHWETTVGSSKIAFFDASFASPDRGWALLSCFYYPTAYPNLYCPAPVPGVNDGTVVFLSTNDGGRTWTRIGG
jgi:photosystem II stability/assembly factor-like uncharacterized protein